MVKKTILSAVALAVVATSSAGLSTGAMAGYHADAMASATAIEQMDPASGNLVVALNKRKLKAASAARKGENRRRELRRNQK